MDNTNSFLARISIFYKIKFGGYSNIRTWLLFLQKNKMCCQLFAYDNVRTARTETNESIITFSYKQTH